MGLLVNNYSSLTGLTVEQAYLRPSSFMYDDNIQLFAFSLDVYADKQAYINHAQPLETNAFAGEIHMDIAEIINPYGIIENAILNKVDLISEKTEQECIAHALEYPNEAWVDKWDYEYHRLIGIYQEELVEG